MSLWKTDELGKFVTLKRGYDLPQQKRVDGAVPIFSSSGVTGTHKEPMVNAPGVITGRYGTIGEVFFSKEPFWPLNTTLYVENFHGNDERFIYYFLKSLKWEKFTSASAVPGINRNTVHKEIVEIPDLESQRKIAAVLSTIDDKIDINQRINDNLEQLAKALFKSWFVDFEPFSNQKPSDWSVSTLGNVSIMGAGGDKPQNVSPIKSNLCQYPIYSNGLSEDGLYGFTDKPKIFKESVTVSARGTIGFVCLRHIPYVPIVRLVTLIPKAEIISAKYLYLWLKQLHITGTGTTQQQLTVPDFRKTEILVPSQEIVTLFTATVEPIFEKIWANQNENEKLSSLRDTLIPKLMSGELDVSDIDL